MTDTLTLLLLLLLLYPQLLQTAEPHGSTTCCKACVRPAWRAEERKRRRRQLYPQLLLLHPPITVLAPQVVHERALIRA